MTFSFARGRATWLVVGCVVGLVVGGGAALAAVPAADGSITACYGPLAGYTRIIDPSKNEKCTSSEKRITWSQQGPAGQPGAPGTRRSRRRRGAPRRSRPARPARRAGSTRCAR